MFSLDNLNKYIANFNGDESTIMRLLENRIIEFTKDERSGFREDEYYMLYEFCLFDDDYFRIKKDMIENNIDLHVVDIGCQFGFQSEIFDGVGYTGVECQHNFFFNQDNKNVNYLAGEFPNENLYIKDKVVISNMSLGFFNSFLGEDIYNDKNVLSEVDNMLIDELSKSKVLYCNSRPAFIEGLRDKFNNSSYLGRQYNSNISTGVYKFWN